MAILTMNKGEMIARLFSSSSVHELCRAVLEKVSEVVYFGRMGDSAIQLYTKALIIKTIPSFLIHKYLECNFQNVENKQSRI